MLTALADLYRQSWRYALACPVLFLLPIVAELAQHVAEYGQGLYASIEAAKALEHSVLRMGFGTIKVLSLLITGYWMMRWLEWRDPKRTRGGDLASLATFSPLLLLELAISLPAIWGPVLAPTLTKPMLLAIPLELVLRLLFSEWSRTAAIGAAGGPIASSRRVGPHFLWALGFYLLAVLPPMVLHYALGAVALKSAGAVQIGALIVDSLFVGYLGAVISGLPWYISERARARLT